MARNNEGIFDEVWAESGDKAQPVFPITTGWDSQYSTPISSGGLAPKRTTFNYTFNQLYALGVDVNQMGAALQWNSTITYQLGATVIGNDGLLYTSLVVGNINFDPNAGANPDKWTAITRYLELSDQTAGTEGSRLVGYNGISVYTAIGARPTFTTLAASGGASLVGTTSGDTVQSEINKRSLVPFIYARTTYVAALDLFNCTFHNDEAVVLTFSSPLPAKYIVSITAGSATARIVNYTISASEIDIRTYDQTGGHNPSSYYDVIIYEIVS